jgi:hypothetical protein
MSPLKQPFLRCVLYWGDVFTELLPSNGRLLRLHYSGFEV